MIDIEYLKEAAKFSDIEISDEQSKKLDEYAKELVGWNEKVNLTAIIEPREIVVKHFVDSLMLLKYIPQGEGIKLIDVGCGAGFPSLPCKIVREDIELTMMDGLNKRIKFLEEVVKIADVKASCVHERAEDACRANKDLGFREVFDISTARAVGHLRELSEMCLPMVKVGGSFVALKGYEIEQEIEEAKKAIAMLGGEISQIYKYELIDSSKRAIVVIKKISQTPTKYPRSYGKMKKSPIK